MRKAALILTLLAVGLASSWAADVVARVPSNFYKGTKWVLFRDESIPDPPPNVIQAENDVQVLPQHPQSQQQYFYPYPVYPAFVGVSTPAPIGPPVHVGDHDTEIVENLAAVKQHQQQQQQPEDQQQYYGPFSVTEVSQTAVHVEGPEYVDYYRKKKNV